MYCIFQGSIGVTVVNVLVCTKIGSEDRMLKLNWIDFINQGTKFWGSKSNLNKKPYDLKIWAADW